MTDEFNTALPSIRQLQTFIKDSTEVEVKLSTSDLVVGKSALAGCKIACVLSITMIKPQLFGSRPLSLLNPS